MCPCHIGILFVIDVQDKEEAARVESQVKIIVRPLYSNPPRHGARIVTEILATPEIRLEIMCRLVTSFIHGFGSRLFLTQISV